MYTTFEKDLEIILQKKNDWRQLVKQQGSVMHHLCGAVLGARQVK